MLYTLPNGKVIELTVEQFLDLTDEEVEYLMSINHGEHIENPFFGSALENKRMFDIDDPEIDPRIDFEPTDE